VSVVAVYAPQIGLSEGGKDIFLDKLLQVVLELGERYFFLLDSDLNGHVGEQVFGYNIVHGGQGLDIRMFYV